MFLDSHHTVFTFRSKFDLLDVVLAFLIFILNIFKSLQNYWHRVTDIKVKAQGITLNIVA